MPKGPMITYAQKMSGGWALRQAGFWLILTLATAFVLVFTLSNSYDLAPGDVALQDIRAPRDLNYVSEILSAQAEAEAVRHVAPRYTSPDSAVARDQYNRARKVLAYLRALRADSYASDSQKYAWLLAVPELSDVSQNTANIIFTLPDANWDRVRLEFLDLLDQVMRQEVIRAADLNEVRQRIPARIALDLAQDEAVAVNALVVRFIRPNVFYDADATEIARQEAREAVGPVFHSLRSGEVIVREGSVISELDMEILQEFGLTARQTEWPDLSVAVLFAGGSVLVLGAYLWRFESTTLDGGRKESLLLLLLLVFLLLARLLIPSGGLLPYLFPAAAMTMLLATTLGLPSAIGAIAFLSGVSGWIGGQSLSLTVFVLLSGVVSALTLPRYEQTGAIFRSGFLAGLVGALVLTVFSVNELFSDPVTVMLKMGVCVVGGIIAGGLTAGGLFVLTPLFDLTTNFRLMELSRPNHPLLQRLLREAPATFNHVMMVTSLSEQAAERIGANALLTRVGAYYHDIGKLLRPYFFVENQQGLSNPHDRLDPYTSVDVLQGHVRDGIKLAKQYRLPARVRAFIPEHHGTMRASFFYQKAIEAAGGEADLVDEDQFRYPGPTPQSRETLLVMLADASEAATRARRPSTPEELSSVVDYIFEERIRAGQLDECPITMQELHIVKSTYIDLLRGAFHPRVKYPEPKKDEPREDSNDDDDQTSN